MTIEDTQNSHVKKKKRENEKCHGPSHGPGGIHRSRRVPWDTFQRGNVDCYEIDYSLVPFTMRRKQLHVIQRNRQNARRGCTELFLLSWRRNLFAFLILGGWFSRKQRAKWSFQVVTWTYIIHLEGFSLKRFSYSAIYYACSNFILFHTIAVETSIHVNSKYLYA